MQCGQLFGQFLSLHVHERILARENPYEWVEYNEAFANLNSLHHYEIIHTGEKIYEC